MDFDPHLALFWLKKLASVAMLPPLLPFLLILAGLLLKNRKPRLCTSTTWTGLIVGLLTITPYPVGEALRLLEPRSPLAITDLEHAEAIVVLGGGRMSNAPEYDGDTVNRYTLERLRYAARLTRRTGLPLLVSGGAPAGDTPEATLMKAALQEDFGVTVRWKEDRSLDTRQNARYSAQILQQQGIGSILLVTHAAHMRRAQIEFESQGIKVIPAPTAWQGPRAGDEDRGWPALPSPSAAYAGWYALYEWLGLLAYRLSR